MKKPMPVNFRYTASQIMKLEALANKTGMTRSGLIHKLVMDGMDQYEFFIERGVNRFAINGSEALALIKKEIKSLYLSEVD